jgi:hypothetical protein
LDQEELAEVVRGAVSLSELGVMGSLIQSAGAATNRESRSVSESLLAAALSAATPLLLWRWWFFGGSPQVREMISRL